METIENKILEILKEHETNGQIKATVIRLEDASEAFEQLVHRGVVQKRGYNLVGMNNLNEFRHRFEVQA